MSKGVGKQPHAKGGAAVPSRGKSAVNAVFAAVLGFGLMVPSTALAAESEQSADEPVVAAEDVASNEAGDTAEALNDEASVEMTLEQATDTVVEPTSEETSESSAASEDPAPEAGDPADTGVAVLAEGGYDITTVTNIDDLDSGINPETGVHEYGTNIDKAWVYQCPDAGASQYGVKISFDEQTFIEDGYDHLYVYAGTYDPDSENNVMVADLSGKVSEGAFGDVYVVGTDTFSLRMVCDSSNGSPNSTEVYWGFKVSEVSALTSNNLQLVGAMAPIQSQLLADAQGGALIPAPQVTYGWGDQEKALVAGTDYDVTYSDNTAVGTAKVTVTGKGVYAGTLTGEFQIVESRTAPVEFDGDATTRWSGDETVSFSGSVSDSGEAGYYAGATVTKVTVGDKEYTGEDLADVTVSADGSVTIPAAWLGLDDSKNSDDAVTSEVTVEIDGYDPLTFGVDVSMSWSDELLVNYYDANGTLVKSHTYTVDEFEQKGMFTEQMMTTYCDSAGMQLRDAEGVTLVDLLEDMGITTDPSQLDYKVTSVTAGMMGGTSTYSGSYLFQDRYYFPIFTDNTTEYSQLEAGLASYIAQNGSDTDAWGEIKPTVARYLAVGETDEGNAAGSASGGLVDGFMSRCETIRELAADQVASGEAYEVEPMLAYREAMTSCTQSGHFITAGENPRLMEAPDLSADEPVRNSFHILYGMALEEENGKTLADNSTTRNYQQGSNKQLDIYDVNRVSVEGEGVSATLDTTGSEYDQVLPYESSRPCTVPDPANWTIGADAAASNEVIASSVASANDKVVASADLSLSKSGEAVTSGFGTLTASFEVGASYNGKTLAVYYLAADGSVATTNVEVVDGVASVSLSNTSFVALAEDASTQQGGGQQGGDNQQTGGQQGGDNQQTGGQQQGGGQQQTGGHQQAANQQQTPNAMAKTGDSVPLAPVAGIAGGAALAALAYAGTRAVRNSRRH